MNKDPSQNNFATVTQTSDRKMQEMPSLVYSHKCILDHKMLEIQTAQKHAARYMNEINMELKIQEHKMNRQLEVERRNKNILEKQFKKNKKVM